MADKLSKVSIGDGPVRDDEVSVRYKDMGDGSYALVVSTDGGGGGGGEFTGLTDEELRATPVPVSGPLTDTQLRATTLPVVVSSGTGTALLTSTVDNTDAQAVQGGSTALRVVARQYVFNGTSWDRQKKANLNSKIPSSAASTNATLVKATAGEVHHISAYNTTEAVKFLKLYNKATAPVPGSDVPFGTYAIPPSGQIDFTFSNGLHLNLGIGIALTGLPEDADTTALAAGDVVAVNVAYA